MKNKYLRRLKHVKTTAIDHDIFSYSSISLLASIWQTYELPATLLGTKRNYKAPFRLRSLEPSKLANTCWHF